LCQITVEPLRQLIENWLVARDASQADLHRASGVPQNVISKWLNGEVARASDRNLKRIAPILGLSYEELLRHMGEIPTTQAGDSGVQSELEMRLHHLGSVLGRYPRAFWLAVIDASERMAEAGEAFQPPVSASKEPSVSVDHSAQTRGNHGSRPGLTPSKPSLTAALVHC